MTDSEIVGKKHTPLIDMQHAAAYGAVALLLFTMLKAYATANFSLTTAAALLTTAPVNVLLGTLVSYSYQVFPLIALGLAVWVALTWKADGWSPRLTLAALCSILAALVSPLTHLGIQALTLAVIGSVLYLVAIDVILLIHRPESVRAGLAEIAGRLPPARSFGFATFAAAVLWMMLQTLTNPWMPVEVVIYGPGCAVSVSQDFDRLKPVTKGVATSCHMTVGHVLNDDGVWTTVVTAADRGLQRIPTESVRFRELCHLSGQQPPGTEPLLWLGDTHQYFSKNASCLKLRTNITGALLDYGTLEPSPR